MATRVATTGAFARRKEGRNARLCVGRSSQSKSVSSFARTCSDCWVLQPSICKLDGRFDITFAVAVLPTTLVSLDLWPTSGPHTICMSTFQCFGKLQTLVLGLGLPDTPEEEEEILEMFLLDAVVPSVEQLEVHGSLHTSIVATCDIVTCLPNVNVLHLAVKASQVGLRLAHQIMEMQRLRKLGLYLYNGNGQDTTLVVPQASLLEQLDLTAPSSNPRLSVRIHKPGVNYACFQTYSVVSGHEPWPWKHDWTH